MVRAASPSGEGPLLLAFSGGPDSCGLALHLLAGSAADLRLGYVDHRLRGRRASRMERAEVRRMARQLDLPLLRARVRVEGSGEAGAREARYRALHAMARRIGARALATAHTMDDRAETILLQLLRGCGLRGLASLAPSRPIDGVLRVRPGIALRREELADRARMLDPILDRSNRSMAHARSRVRAHLLPALAARLGEDPVPLLIALGDRAAEIRSGLEVRAASLGTQRHRLDWLAEPAATFPYRVEALRGAGPPLTGRAYAALRAFLRAGRGDRAHRTPGGERWRLCRGRVEVEREGADQEGSEPESIGFF